MFFSFLLPLKIKHFQHCTLKSYNKMRNRYNIAFKSDKVHVTCILYDPV